MPLTSTELLGPEGPIAAKIRGAIGASAYETRPQQQQMAEAVSAALAARGRLLVEAGTGVGKSFAYLVPAMLRARYFGEKVVIATATISLQEQLIEKDIPLIMATLDQWGDAAAGASVTAGTGTGVVHDVVPVLAKGRGNYLSIRRLKVASQRQRELLHDEPARASLRVIEQWAYTTLDGSMSTLPALERGEVWDHVRSDSDNCMGRKCPHYKECFYQSSRRALEQANVIICNHALFFSDLALRTRGGLAPGSGPLGAAILPNYDHVIFDEAHNLEDAAGEHFGLSLALPRVLRLLRTLYSARRRTGYLTVRGLMLGNEEHVERAVNLVLRAEQACAEFFDDLAVLAQKAAAAGGRIRVADAVENPLTPAMRELAARLRLIREAIESEADRFELQSFARRAEAVADMADVMVAQTLPEYVYWVESSHAGAGGGGGGSRGGASGRSTSSTGFDDLDHPGEGDEAGKGTPVFGGPFSAAPGSPVRSRPRVTLSCAPVEVAAILKRCLFNPDVRLRAASIDEGTPDEASPASESGGDGAENLRESKPIGVVLTSATLATRAIKPGEHPERAETAFAHVMANLGIGQATTLQLGSPFDYAKQAKVIVDMTAPDPRHGQGSGGTGGSGGQVRSVSGGGAGSGADLLAKAVLRHVIETDGGAFVLFTSFQSLYAVADRIGPELRRRGIKVLAQGRDGPRAAMLREFLLHDNAVLCGAASFWQGVDVRGERLRNVIITRLPFEPPDRPLTQARTERLGMAGLNPFMQDALPRAIIRFKQGFGRLIRSKTDVGRVVVLDPRIVTARYGRMFIEALPEGVPVERAAEIAGPGGAGGLDGDGPRLVRDDVD